MCVGIYYTFELAEIRVIRVDCSKSSMSHVNIDSSLIFQHFSIQQC